MSILILYSHTFGQFNSPRKDEDEKSLKLKNKGNIDTLKLIANYSKQLKNIFHKYLFRIFTWDSSRNRQKSQVNVINIAAQKNAISM